MHAMVLNALGGALQWTEVPDRELGVHGAGGSDQALPEPMDVAIPLAPVGARVPLALKAVRKGGTCRLRWNPHEPDTRSYLRSFMGWAGMSVGSQPHA